MKPDDGWSALTAVLILLWEGLAAVGLFTAFILVLALIFWR